ncbi:2-C-methyl-D-erythritol 2,4-cyclodiphosphate synthase [Thermosyntropha lipolytica DSM 11003]|uniref:Bifunctional enzyme IspD/IspF n=1 Tax=Thermosyntropha lipolytica DSM 11003 TaxID=1123382 RepID=A0A1M5NSD4_9FIRM|nr:bifunctional 2-C-methyl-D-erythritol 4-phosphate cytidylyltransferase/2-C-methyl-D-erythritol 2,4-cyclodiphosphate synthase [Thermosyntropha lipolytica]SHG92109.1 2-C-methyl-D-erythritol 2,4-cyclodiphosphate synthase [Thermosyntropha lipolytica DSM 11003]
MASGLEVVVAAAGRGSRMQADINKQYIMLKGKPVLFYSLHTLEQMELVKEVVVVAHPEEIEYCLDNVIGRYGFKKVKKVIPGGKERQDSVEQGLKALSGDTEMVAVHDGARPLFEPKMLEDLYREALIWGGAVPGVKVKDTVKKIDEKGLVLATLKREELVAVQTPQVFRYNELLYAYARAREEGFYGTDDASLYERYVGRVKVVAGDERNIKITIPEDMIVAERLMEGNNHNFFMPVRVGTGYDVHRLVEGRKLILGGVEIPHTRGLLGHSDADVLIHAVCDALLGGAALGDIGKHFPDHDERYKGISSLVLLKEVAKKIEKAGFKVVNIDSTVVAEEPRLAPYIDLMRRNIAQALEIDWSRISVKATTTEGLGFEGEKRGISAQAVALLTGGF